ncbi:T9SS type A sorting domain-containing protein [Aurantibacillus circumpalustris]|uniref:T9SS type A sorting domain-containing protein n=1 Tax=Aurantibacillus circumpalustris TaxID=3036359 RepID=UPI00295B453C|nr:T9SS type A sorting domain-containing protein [Aurantibacillus circumpalustris]
MNKKQLFLCLALLTSSIFSAQTPEQLKNYCGAGVPSQQWDSWLNSKVEEYKDNLAHNKTALVVREIPVIVHIIYFNEPIGTYPNLDTNQVKSQIAALNRDFSGTGVNVNNVPSVFSGLVSNTGIQFCLARKDRQDQPMNPRGIERISASANIWQSPSTPTLDLKAYFNNVIIPLTYWDPTKYLNIWVSDKPVGYPMNGFATYPPGSGLAGIFGGTFGTTTNDGIWVYAKAFGTATAGAVAPYDEGRTATHEIGHWLGLRHIWGDGNCLSDYCTDTPTAKQAHYGCVTTTPIDGCGVGTSPNGEMPMNFMDRSDDACMYMFTPDQNIRMQTVLSQSSLRYLLGTHSKCSEQALPTSSAVASFETQFQQCLNKPFTPFNTSSGFPYPTYIWSSSPAANFFPSNSVPNPAVTINNPGYYTLTLVATNSLSSSTATFVVTAQNTCAVQSQCLDTARAIKKTDTLTTYRAPVSSVNGCGNLSTNGNLVGTNCYKDKEFAQYFAPNTYSTIPNPQVNSVIVLFDSAATKSPYQNTQVVCKIYGGSVGGGPTSSQGSKSDSITKILLTPADTSVDFVGKPGKSLITKRKIIPFRFDFASPIIISSPSSGFFVGLQIPFAYGDSVGIVTNTKFNSSLDSSAWYLNSNNSWQPYKSTRGYKVQMAVVPVITCGPVGVREEGNLLGSGVTVMPNPSNGIFNFVFTFQKEQYLSLNITSAFGQLISYEKLRNITNNVISVDLSQYANGIYFAEISNGTERIVKKIIVNH